MSIKDQLFTLEDDMLPHLRHSGVTGVFEQNTKTVFVSEKVQVGVIIPDLVFAISSGNKPLHRSGTRMTHFECAVLSEIVKDGSATLEKLCQSLYATDDKVHEAVKKILQRGVVKMTDGRIKAIKSRLPKFKIISVEAKLTRWREALDQAVEYLQFSNSAYVAMPEPFLIRNPTIATSCKTAGIGLLSVDKTNVRMLVKGRSQAVMSGKWLWTIERMVNL